MKTITGFFSEIPLLVLLAGASILLMDCHPSAQTISPSTKMNANSLDDRSSKISMKLLQISKDEGDFEIANNSSEPIFLFYEQRLSENSEANIARYWLRCRNSAGAESDYNQFTSHIVPTLNKLEARSSIIFSVKPLPEIGSKCRISVLYYDDPAIEDIINHHLLDADESQRRLIENNKKSVATEFTIPES